MAPNPSCSALAAAKERKGLSYSAIAQQIGKSEQHVIDICTGKVAASGADFNAIARVLGVSSDGAPKDSTHSK